MDCTLGSPPLRRSPLQVDYEEFVKMMMAK
jgi:hypothetical protein